jgi:galactonate dehydratase
MKITRLTTYAVPPRWLFLKIQTDDGIVGWGEPVVEGRAATVAACVEELSDYLIGCDPRNIEDLWQVMYRGGFYRGGPILMSAIAGIDQALWDIKGKACAMSVAQLLGGRCAIGSRCTPGSAAIGPLTPPWPLKPLPIADSLPSR